MEEPVRDPVTVPLGVTPPIKEALAGADAQADSEGQDAVLLALAVRHKETLTVGVEEYEGEEVACDGEDAAEAENEALPLPLRDICDAVLQAVGLLEREACVTLAAAEAVTLNDPLGVLEAQRELLVEDVTLGDGEAEGQAETEGEIEALEVPVGEEVGEVLTQALCDEDTVVVAVELRHRLALLEELGTLVAVMQGLEEAQAEEDMEAVPQPLVLGVIESVSVGVELTEPQGLGVALLLAEAHAVPVLFTPPAVREIVPLGLPDAAIVGDEDMDPL